jgi:hypothetical protein
LKDLGVHLALLLLISTAIVTLGAFYGEADDRAARALWPKQMAKYLLGLALLVVVLLACEHTFAALE